MNEKNARGIQELTCEKCGETVRGLQDALAHWHQHGGVDFGELWEEVPDHEKRE